MVVSVLAGPLMAFGGAESETGTVAEQILQEAEDSVKRIRTVIEDARGGNPESQYELGGMILDKTREYRGPSNLQSFQAHAKALAEATLEALTWFTRAAEQGHDFSQMRLYKLYSRKYPPDYSFMTDYVLAYAWLTVALNQGVSVNLQVGGVKVDPQARLRTKMSAEQVAEAQKLAATLWERIESSKSK
jgi:TPR repeat protein